MCAKWNSCENDWLAFPVRHRPGKVPRLSGPIADARQLAANERHGAPYSIKAAFFDTPVPEMEFVLPRRTLPFAELRQMQSAGSYRFAWARSQAASREHHTSRAYRIVLWRKRGRIFDDRNNKKWFLAFPTHALFQCEAERKGRTISWPAVVLYIGKRKACASPCLGFESSTRRRRE